VTIPSDIKDQVESTSAGLGTSVDKTVELLPRYGMAIQNKRELEIASFTEGIATSKSDSEAETLANRLGELIFGR